MTIKSFKPFFALDFVIIAISTAIGYAYLKGIVPVWPDFLNIGRDWSAGEVFGYIKWIMLAFAFLTAYVREKAAIFLALFVVTLILLADDSLQIHETFGPFVVESIGLQNVMGVKAYTIGPMVVWGVLGVFVVSFTWMGWRTAPIALRRKLYPVFGFFLAIVFFAVGIDAIHELIDFPKVMKGVMGVFEDGGEMIVMTALLRYGWRTFRT